MSYVITGSAPSGVGSVLLRRDSVSDALQKACELIADGLSVSITGPNNTRIDGDALEACCRGEKSLSEDLQAN